MYITRRTLQDAGLEVHLDKKGLSITGNAPMPEEVREHITAIGDLMQFSPIEYDRLGEHIHSVGIWNALRGCKTEV